MIASLAPTLRVLTGTLVLGILPTLGIAQDIARLPPIQQDLNHPLSMPSNFDTMGGTVPEATQTPWWQPELESQLAAHSVPVDVTVETLVAGALQSSHQIRAFSDLPLIREQTITEEDGVFDWRVFGETGYRKTSDPVGNTLTTGGPTRFRESDFDTNLGFRRLNRLGGEFEILQDFGLTNNNSVFFIPEDQGTSRLTMRYNHPLMRGRGLYYNTSQVYLAMLDTAAANHEFSRQVQSQILEVSRGYWALYVERAHLLQRVKLVRESEDLYNILEQRQNLDVGRAQLLRAQSAAAQRRSDLARTQTAVRNAESRIVSLVNDPYLEDAVGLEMLPVAHPQTTYEPVNIDESKMLALQYRPEIAQARVQIQAAARRLDMAVNELMPYLNVVMETYVSGLRGSDDIGQAWVDQFSVGEPSYFAGLVLEYPLGNRTASARKRRREIEVRQLQSQLRATIETLMLEVEVAVREVQTSYSELQSKQLAMQASQAEVVALRKRWEVMAGNDPSAALYLDNLLSAQVRLAEAERQLAQSLATYNLSLVNLSRAQGTLLQDQHIEITRLCCNCMPQLAVGYDTMFFEDLRIGEELMTPEYIELGPSLDDMPAEALVVPEDAR